MQEWRLGSYQLIRRLGEGGMAHVYLARDVRLGREVAVKVLDRQLAERPGFRERFLREARLAAALDHPNIVPLYDFGESGVLYLVMPFVSGGSLQDLLHRAPLPTGQVATYGSQIADALEYAHARNVVHRDVKPANMLLHADGRLMLSDFGLAKILDGSRPAAPRGRPDAGTPEYMAPEQIEGRTDSRSDVYALGVVLYLLLTGRLPFSGGTSKAVMDGHLYRLVESPRRLNPAIPPAMEAVVLRALAKHSEDRFQHASELGAALLGALVAGDAGPLPPLSAPSSSLPPISPAPLGPVPSVGYPSLHGPRSAGTTRRDSFTTSVLPRLDTPLAGNSTTSTTSAFGRGSSHSMPLDLGELLASVPRSTQSAVPHSPSAFSPRPPSVLPPSSPVPPSVVPRGRKPPDSIPIFYDRSQWLWIVLCVLTLLMLGAAAVLLRWIQIGPPGVGN